MASPKTKAQLEQEVQELKEKVKELAASGTGGGLKSESLQQLEQRVAEREARAEQLEALIIPFARYDASLKLAENKKLTVCDVGLRVDRLRALVNCALQIEGDGEAEEE